MQLQCVRRRHTAPPHRPAFTSAATGRKLRLVIVTSTAVALRVVLHSGISQDCDLKRERNREVGRQTERQSVKYDSSQNDFFAVWYVYIFTFREYSHSNS